MFLYGERNTIDVSCGMKIGHSPYVLCAHETPRNISDIIDFFMVSTLEDAVRRAVLSDYFKENGYVMLITGDGQVYELNLDPKKKEE